MALPAFKFACPDCDQPIDLGFSTATIRRMGSLVQIPILVTDAQWIAAMDDHIAEADEGHPPRATLGL